MTQRLLLCRFHEKSMLLFPCLILVLFTDGTNGFRNRRLQRGSHANAAIGVSRIVARNQLGAIGGIGGEHLPVSPFSCTGTNANANSATSHTTSPVSHSPTRRRHRVSETALQSTTAPSNTGSFKFKNVEEMLDSFRAEPLLLAFTAVNCGPCRLQKKELAAVKETISKAEHKHPNKTGFRIVSIDTGKWPAVGTKFSVGKLPCLVVMKDGVILFRSEGLTKAEVVVEQVQSLRLLD